MSDAAFHSVATTDQVVEGKMIAVDVDGRDVLICRTKDGWFALDNVCTHAYARLHEGRLRGTRVICPLHGASFDCRTGAVLGAPAYAPLAAHRIRIVDDRVEVALGG